MPSPPCNSTSTPPGGIAFILIYIVGRHLRGYARSLLVESSPVGTLAVPRRQHRRGPKLAQQRAQRRPPWQRAGPSGRRVVRDPSGHVSKTSGCRGERSLSVPHEHTNNKSTPITFEFTDSAPGARSVLARVSARLRGTTCTAWPVCWVYSTHAREVREVHTFPFLEGY